MDTVTRGNMLLILDMLMQLIISLINQEAMDQGDTDHIQVLLKLAPIQIQMCKLKVKLTLGMFNNSNT